MEQEYCEKGIFNLMAACIEHTIRTKKGDRQSIEKQKQEAREFSKSKMIDLFCDCSYNFEAERLRKIIIEKNK